MVESNRALFPEESSRWGVIFLCHGSQRGTSPAECSCSWPTTGDSPSQGSDPERLPDWCRHCPSTSQGLGEAARRLQAMLSVDRAEVLMSCLEFIEPHPDQAVHRLADQGLRQMVVMPYLLGHGKHATLELDEVLDDIRAQLPQVQLSLSEGLGADPRLADLVMERLGDLDIPAKSPHPPSAKGEQGGNSLGTTGILLVKAGTRTQYDDCLWFEELGQMVEKRLGVGYAVAVAQSHYGDPTMEAAAAGLVEARGATSMVCVPYVFFPGMILRRNVLGGLNVLRGKYPDVNMTITPPLGVDDRLLEVAADRIKAVWNEQGAGS